MALHIQDPKVQYKLIFQSNCYKIFCGYDLFKVMTIKYKVHDTYTKVEQ